MWKPIIECGRTTGAKFRIELFDFGLLTRKDIIFIAAFGRYINLAFYLPGV